MRTISEDFELRAGDRIVTDEKIQRRKGQRIVTVVRVSEVTDVRDGFVHFKQFRNEQMVMEMDVTLPTFMECLRMALRNGSFLVREAEWDVGE